MLKKKEAAKKKSGDAKQNSHGRIVVIGASAGGLEAVCTLLRHLPEKTGMTFFYVQHLSPDHASNLAALLSSATQMNVLEAKSGLPLLHDYLYVCTPNQEIALINDKIKLIPRKTTKLPYLPINGFFLSVAKKYRDRTVGIILSGNGTDGTDGLRSIIDYGGIGIVQDKSAKNAAMPKSASAGSSDVFVLSPRDIAKRLVQISGDSLTRGLAGDKRIDFPDNSPELKLIMDILRRETKVDFSHYKRSTLKRRLNYRMLHAGTTSLSEYAKMLQKKSSEAKLLHKDLLINVTGFFRDTKTVGYLKSTLLPKLLKNKSPNDTLRFWVPACSTGEEVYSLAILITEVKEKLSSKIPVQIFASDLSELAIQDARLAEYSADDLKPLSNVQIKRFFLKTGERYRVVKELREICVFAHHNILSDPPFSRMDLISCCNLLIYFDAPAQKKVLATLSFALKNEGYLVLGKSESVGDSSPFFLSVHSRYKVYSRRRSTETRKIPELMPRLNGTAQPPQKTGLTVRKSSSAGSKELDNAIDALLISQHMPACAVINKHCEIIKFRGSTALFLSHPQGNASLNILKMTRPECSLELRLAIQESVKTGARVRKENIELKIDAKFRMMSLEVSPINVAWDEPLFLIVFSLHENPQTDGDSAGGGQASSSQVKKKMIRLTEELQKTRSEMQSIIESQEVAFGELQAANEEIVSTNEEFQTLNEELETSKEEIEATNEELLSTNQELQMRNELLTESYEYSEAIIATIHEPLLILNNQLEVEFANKSYYRKFLVTPEEIAGVSLFELDGKLWDIPELRKLLEVVISKNTGFNNYEVKHQFPDLGEKIMLLNAHRIVQKTHREQYVLLAIEDVTERTRHHLNEKEVLKKDIRLHKAHKLELEQAVKKRTRQLERKNIELEELNKDLTSFTYVSSHDLQEPLRKIQNFVSVLVAEEKRKLSPAGKQYLGRLYATANRMQKLIEDLLAYSRTKNLERNFEDTDLRQLMDTVKLEYEDAIKEGKIIFKYGSLNTVRIIRFQFGQLLHNLIGNSLKFAKKNTRVVVTISSKMITGTEFNKKHSLHGRSGIHGDIRCCHITYTDNGIGFEPEYSERIFQVFQRLNSEDEYQGSGMGLAICKRIIENHKGIILATGKPNKGVQFDICIPVGKPLLTV